MIRRPRLDTAGFKFSESDDIKGEPKNALLADLERVASLSLTEESPASPFDRSILLFSLVERVPPNHSVALDLLLPSLF